MPRVAGVFGPAYAARLYAEHRMGQSAVRRLLRLPEGEWLLPREREMLLEDLRAISEHVLSCGTLLSVLADLPEPEEAQLLERLEGCRAAGRRWSELPPPAESKSGEETGDPGAVETG